MQDAFCLRSKRWSLGSVRREGIRNGVGRRKDSHANEAGQTEGAETHAEPVEELATRKNGILGAMFVILASLLNHRLLGLDVTVLYAIQLGCYLVACHIPN